MQEHWLEQVIYQHSTWRQCVWNSSSIKKDNGLNAEALNSCLSSSKKIFKHDRTTTVALASDYEQPFVLKRYNARSRWHVFKRAFRRSRARRCWQMSYQFQRAGLYVAAPVLMLEKRLGPIRMEAYFMNQYLQGKELLNLLPTMQEVEQKKVVAEIKRVFQQMKAHRISHGDMKASNMMWVEEKLYFIDLDAAQKHITPIGWLAANRKDRKRFLKNWQSQPRILALFEDLTP